MTKIITTEKSPTGYAIQDGDHILMIDQIVDDGKTLKLPENSSNRKYYSIKRIQEGKVELTRKESVTLGPRDPKNKWEEYMTEEEKSTIQQIKELCIQRMEADKPSSAELEIRKLMAKRDKLLAQIQALQNN